MKYKVLLGPVKDSFQIIGRGTVISFETTWPYTVNVSNDLLLILPDTSEIGSAVMGIEHVRATPPLANPYGLLLGDLPSNRASIPPGTQVYIAMNTDNH